MFKEGFGLDVPNVLTPSNQIMQALYKTIDSGKKIVYDVTDVSIDAAKQGFKNFDEADELKQVTEWELSKILRDEDLFKNTTFHKNGKEISKQDLGLKLIEE